MKEIGGYIGLESPVEGFQNVFEGIPFQSGRGCLNFLLQTHDIRSVRLPFYCCESLVQPFAEQEITVEFYAIDHQLTPSASVAPKPHEAVVVINYFGLLDGKFDNLSDKVWIDNTQAFFAASSPQLSFNSCRKFFGVPDGGFLHGIKNIPEPFPRNTDYELDHLVLRAYGDAQAGYSAFQRNEAACGRGGCRGMSEVSERILKQLDLDTIRRKRRANFQTLHEQLSDFNQLDPSVISADNAVPFCYPLLPKSPIQREYFWNQRIYIPALWRDCLDRTDEGFEWERQLSSDLLPLPIDHRYSNSDMNHLADTLAECFQ